MRLGLRVQRRQCSTCIFRPDGPWRQGQLDALLAEIADPNTHGHFTGHRVCHHSRDAVCAGFWARYKDHFQAGQLAQRLNLVRRVDDDVI
jgi:hypothetical protein